MSKPNYVAYIPVRGGSQGIPGKNIKSFCEKPLFYWAARAASECSMISKVLIGSDSDEILGAVKKLDLPKLATFKRGTDSTSNTASTESAISEVLPEIEAANIVLIQATNPFLKEIELTKAIAEFESKKLDSLVSGVRAHRFIWRNNNDGTVKPLNYDPASRPRRQDWAGELIENGSFYIFSKTSFIKSGSRLSGRIGFYEMSEESYFEIDSNADWAMAESIFKQGLSS